ncbi:MAG: 3-phosphoshikimate 1-carboxyvinyltransferase [Bacteroidales bacterium]
MIAEFQRSEINGRISAPASKSAMQRIIAAALLAEGTSRVSAVSMCEDSEAALEIARALGATVDNKAGKLLITGGFKPVRNEFTCGESGLSARMFTPVAALHNSEIKINGKGSLLKRPFDMITGPMGQLGVTVKTTGGYLPLTIKGPLAGGRVIADGSVSSQFITGLLMSLPRSSKDSELIVQNLVSKPYVDLTIKILGQFGINIINENYSRFLIPGRQKFNAISIGAEGDWSGGAFLLVLGAIGGYVEISGLEIDSVQADKAILDALRLAGAEISFGNNAIKVKKTSLSGFRFNISDCPDLAPPLAVLGLACSGRTVIEGTERLLAKESNRAESIVKSLTAIGGNITAEGNRIIIDGGRPLAGGSADSFNDHRIAMALATASVICSGNVTVTGMESINKSYPGFIKDFRSLNGNVLVN